MFVDTMTLQELADRLRTHPEVKNREVVWLNSNFPEAAKAVPSNDPNHHVKKQALTRVKAIRRLLELADQYKDSDGALVDDVDIEA